MTVRVLAGGGGASDPRDPDFKLVTTLLQANSYGVSAGNGANNSVILDSSGNSYSQTISGAPCQGRDSPFSAPAGYWSTYMDGGSEYYKIATHDDFAFGTGAFTIEMWIWRQQATHTYSGHMALYDGRNGGGSNRVYLYINASDKLVASINASDKGTSSSSIPDNQWVHVALTRTGSYGYLYINGTQEASFSDSTDIAKPSSHLYIGVEQDASSNDFLGWMSNVRVLKGTAAYTSGYSVPSTPLTAITNTKLLIASTNNMLEDRSSSNHTLLANSSPEQNSFSPFQLPAGSAAYDAAVHGGSISFERAESEYITMSHSNFAMGTGNFTIEGWVKFTKNSEDHGIYHTSSGAITTGSTEGPSIGVATGSYYWTIYSGAGTKTFDNTPKPQLYTWYHFAMVRGTVDGMANVLRLYINGVKANDGGYDGWVDNTNYTWSNIAIGTYYQNPYSHTGQISNLRVVKGTAIYTDNFTPPTAPVTNTGSETVLLLNGTNGGIVDASRNFNFRTRGNTQVDTTTKKFGTGSIEFNGHTSGQQLEGPANVHYGGNNLQRILNQYKFTVEFWLYVTSYHAAYMDIVGVFNGSSSGWLIYQNGTNLDAYINGSTMISATAPSTGAWHHVALTRDGTTLRMFVNGSLHGSATTSSTGISQTQYPLLLGETGSRNALNGFIDDFRITLGKARYTSNFTAPTEEFLAI